MFKSLGITGRLFSAALLALTSPSLLNAASNEQAPPRILNFSLPSTQQPGPLIAFGNNVIEKNDKQLFLEGLNTHNDDEVHREIIPAFLYGLSDSASLFLSVPVSIVHQQNEDLSSGMEDTTLAFEYAFYNKSSSTHVDQATVVTNVSFPSGSTNKNPPTGIGAPSFFIGTTFMRMYTDWFAFSGYGATLTTASDNTQFGDSYYYQYGLGKTVSPVGSSWLVALMTEVDGKYNTQDKLNGMIDPDSGGNLITVTPSLFLSTKKIVIQLGTSLPLTQHLFGNQNHFHTLYVLNLGWTF